MKHSFIDKYSYIESPIHKLPALFKIIFSFIFLIYVVLLKEAWWNYLIIFSLLLFFIFLSHIPPLFVFKRAGVILPFVLLVTIFLPFFKEDGLKMAIITFTKSFLSIIILILLISTTKFSDLISGLSKLRVPNIILMMLSFIYRYFFVLIDEAERMERAARLRSNQEGSKLLKTLSNIVGILFIRSYEKSERIYNAMFLRGFDGEKNECN